MENNQVMEWNNHIRMDGKYRQILTDFFLSDRERQVIKNYILEFCESVVVTADELEFFKNQNRNSRITLSLYDYSTNSEPIGLGEICCTKDFVYFSY